MGLIDLPRDVLVSLPDYLDNIEDFTNASSSCRTLRHSFAGTHPNRIIRLAAASSRVFFRPDPWFLVAATARQVGQWGLKSQENTEALRDAFRGGIENLKELCIDVAGLTIEDIRRLHASRFETIYPVADLIDRMAGAQWYSTPDFWDGGVSDAYTVDCEPLKAVFHFAIYGELFESTLQSWLEPEKGLPRFDLATRLDYIRYCIPDWIFYLERTGLGAPQREKGPYMNEADVNNIPGWGAALRHILSCGRWNRPWAAIRQQVGPEWEEDSWRQQLWVQAAQIHGLAGLEMLVPGGEEKWRARLSDIRARVAAMEAEPEVQRFGQLRKGASDCPDLNRELFVVIGM
ncbi:hypothetical protein BJ875DRAFT_504717 [Amylocarpus encephaloides]|uniref:Uncharacterized protein n=1 Tax=Amylocarpus encephaloides TaxID=45428 RepID=A0A9P7YJT8_9HELO|nr:hypothetical protein BJ875DRAFT_504717 [Amylocarpus encephaloides]